MTELIANSGIYNAVVFMVDQQGDPVTGLTDVEISIIRLSDDFVLDWSDLTFKATGSVVTRTLNVPELDSVTQPGMYEVSIDFSTITNETFNDTYSILARSTTAEYEAPEKFKTDDIAAKRGFGDFTITITVQDSGTTPIPSVDVKIKDSTDSVVIARKTTDALGQVIVDLDAGTYNVHLTRTGYDFPGSPETLVVTADGSVTYTGDLIVIPPAAGGVVCRVSGNVYDENNNPVQNVTVRAVLEGDSNFVDADPSTLVMPFSQETLTDVNGAWFLDLIRSANITPIRGKDVDTYRFTFQMENDEKETRFDRVTVPDQSSANFKDIA